jgi:hypothetical protein
MNIPWTLEGALSFEPPVSTAGCYIRLRAAIDLVIAFSACPQDILPINGRAGKPTEAHFRIELSTGRLIPPGTAFDIRLHGNRRRKVQSLPEYWRALRRDYRPG